MPARADMRAVRHCRISLSPGQHVNIVALPHATHHQKVTSDDWVCIEEDAFYQTHEETDTSPFAARCRCFDSPNNELYARLRADVQFSLYTLYTVRFLIS